MDQSPPDSQAATSSQPVAAEAEVVVAAIMPEATTAPPATATAERLRPRRRVAAREVRWAWVLCLDKGTSSHVVGGRRPRAGAARPLRTSATVGARRPLAARTRPRN